jgi:lipopolysaccharide/colanic/teichoic acid biosynthesis glycosyltransferase
MWVQIPMSIDEKVTRQMAGPMQTPKQSLPLAMGGAVSAEPRLQIVPDARAVAGCRTRRVYARFAKRGIDLVLALVALAVMSPVLALTALLIRLTMGSPIIFPQERVGLNGETFTVLKFRTMKPDRRVSLVSVPASFDRRKTHKTRANPLLTPLGRFLRKWSIDEFPQIFNVLRGEMSIVGPRPELPSVVATYEDWQHARFLVRPGLTGLWQITARGEGLMHERTDLDVEYLRVISLRTDLRIIAATPQAMLGDHKGF